MPRLYIGLMSGTSLDGVDGVLVDFQPSDGSLMAVLAHAHRPFPAALAAEWLALNTPGANELHRAALAGNALARLYAEVVSELLGQTGTARETVVAIGAHGQTVRHRPGEFDTTGYTVQVQQGALLAELTGIDVVADFRSRDIAAGGQGAPLVPAFHRAVFARAGEPLAVLNLGGISNLTAVAADGTAIGFDCGPANALMDHWCQRHTGRPFDDGGDWAARGTVLAPLLAAMQSEPYFRAPPPKSSGRDLFHPDWLARHLRSAAAERARPEDVQATLCELTAVTCAAAVMEHGHGARELLVCGGGALNRQLMARLAAHLPGCAVRPTDARGLPALQVEACAFAWLAQAHVERRNGNLPSVTGAAGGRILGALYPAR